MYESMTNVSFLRSRMMSIIRLNVMAVGLLWFGVAASRAANTYYVATNGPGGGATTWLTATNNIQDAISLCSSNDTVLVSNGVYEVGGIPRPGYTLTNRVYIYKVITVKSANNDPTNTVIMGRWDPDTTNGPAAVRCVFITNCASLIGFTLTNGASLTNTAAGNADRYGGGIYCESSWTNLIISNCVITGNIGGSRGGGSHYGVFSNCTIAGNSADYAGGVWGGTLTDCRIIGNSTIHEGGVRGSTLYNCLLVGNSGTSGGGARLSTLYNCSLVSNSANNGGGAYESDLYNCRVSGNTAATSGGGVDNGDLYNCLVSGNEAVSDGGGVDTCNLYNCTIVGNSAGTSAGGMQDSISYNSIIYFNYAPASANYGGSSVFTNSCTTPTNAVWASGNITNDPIFVANGNGYGTNHVAGNYRLKKNSPCINKGLIQTWMTTNVFDLDGRRRLDKFTGQVDMGCYEYIPSGTMYIFR